jgi:AcrR family transcriptional regulator
MADHPYHHGGLRAALLSHAEGTLRTSGVEGLSLRELAREIGVSHGAPRRHFLDKAALLDALAVDGFRRLEETLAQAAEPDNRTFVSRLTDVAVAYVRFATGNPALLDLMFTHKHQADASEELQQAANASVARVNALVELGQSTGELVDGDPESIAFVLFATLQGIASLANTNMVDRMTLDELTAYAVNSLLKGLTPHRRARR